MVGLLLAGCVAPRHSINYDTDKYSYEALERRFGKLARTADNSGFASVDGYGIWERIYIKTSTIGDDSYRIDYINLSHREGTLFKDWKRGIETFFHVDTEVEKLTYHREPYNGWRVELSTSSNVIDKVFCWMDDQSHRDLDISLDGKVTWKWGRVLFREYYKETREQRTRQQKELKEKKDA